MSAARLVVLGDLLYDCFVWADRLPRVGETVIGFKNGFYAGGKGGNQAVAAARLGADVAMISKVGADERGEFLTGALKDNGVDASGVIVSAEEDTGTCCVLVDGRGDNQIIVVPLANETITEGEIEARRGLIEGADAFVAQLQVSIEAIGAALRIARAAGVTTVLNPAPMRDIPDEFFALSDWVTPNETEAELYSGLRREGLPFGEWTRAAAAAIHKKGARRVVITCGEKGAYLSSDEGEGMYPPFEVAAVDSTAAGDAFTAAFSIAIASGEGVDAALRRARAAGALTASKHGSQPSLPYKDELDEFLRERE